MTTQTTKPLEDYLPQKWRFFLAKKLGRKFVGTDAVQGGIITRCHGYTWRGCTYITEIGHVRI